MGNIAWIFLGRASGLLAGHLIPRGVRGAQDLAVTCVFGIARALPGGWTAANLCHMAANETAEPS
jgi:uncharacterized membrane protein YeaQ/YmgE (transglycosylase-associated protein family)